MAIGSRYLQASWNKSLGAYVSYDFRRSHACFQQIGTGLEVLDDNYAIRINGYFPIGNRIDAHRSVVFNYPGGWRASCSQQRKDLSGCDAEVETRFQYCLFDFYTALGIYYYRNSFNCSTVRGNRLRLEGRYANIQFGTIVSYDETFHCKIQGFIGFVFFIWRASALLLK